MRIFSSKVRLYGLGLWVCVMGATLFMASCTGQGSSSANSLPISTTGVSELGLKPEQTPVRLGEFIVNLLGNDARFSEGEEPKRFYDRVEVKNVDYKDPLIGYLLYRGDEHLMTLFPEDDEDGYGHRILGIRICSPSFHPQGFEDVRVGTSVHELAQKRDIVLHYQSGPDFGFVQISVPGLDRSFMVEVDPQGIKEEDSWADEDGFVDREIPITALPSDAKIRFICLGQWF